METDLSPAAEAVASERALDALLAPRSVAVFGASDRTELHRVTLANVSAGETTVVGVNPNRREALGVPCVPSAGALPFAPDLAVLLVGDGALEPTLADALGAGIRAFVVPGLGNDAGPDGPALAERLGAAVRGAGGTLLGPNCMGAAVPGGCSPWVGTLPPSLQRGTVAVATQSGAIGEALTGLGPRLPLRCVVSLGYESGLDTADLCRHFAAEEETRAVGLFLETVRRPAELRAGLELLAASGKPVVCLKVGRSPAAARAARAHTGADVGSDGGFAALARATGTLLADSYGDFVEMLDLLSRRRRPRGYRIGAVTLSGGEAALLADGAQAAGIPFPPTPPELAEALAAVAPSAAHSPNPLDGWVVAETEATYRRIFATMAASGQFDVLLAQLDMTPHIGALEQDNALTIVRALLAATPPDGPLPVVLSQQGEAPPPAVAAVLDAADVPVLRNGVSGLRALAAVGGWSPPRAPGPGASRAPATAAAPPLGELAALAGALTTEEGQALLARYGLRAADAREGRDGVHVALLPDRAYGPVLALRACGATAAPLHVLAPLDRLAAQEALLDAGLQRSARGPLADALTALARLAFEQPRVHAFEVALLGDGPDARAVASSVTLTAPWERDRRDGAAPAPA
ncbi:CoA-binding protein [Conexibacter arvalis]|uniref:Acetyltransferase n=1 Tax=Conexibacter arvalis TaxID=912552 RepID=A0A840ICR9_9ACTN|nr:CoA-binding protein [Conexibacter arvalis]MBB4662013.1 acetyltransferase [Conexibacter arvalis]